MVVSAARGRHRAPLSTGTDGPDVVRVVADDDRGAAGGSGYHDHDEHHHHPPQSPSMLAARLGAQFAHSTRHRYLADVLRSDEHKTLQSDYLERIAVFEKDMLSRTVFVSGVKDMRKRENVHELKRFFERRYGPVKTCKSSQPVPKNRRDKKLHYNENVHSMARVEFRRREDAEKIFGGSELLRVASKKPVYLHCPDLAKKEDPGSISVKPCERYPDMAKEALQGSVIEFSSTALSLGHWFPAEDDIYKNWRREEGEDGQDDTESRGFGGADEWLEAVNTKLAPFVRIHLNKRLIEIWVPRHEDMVDNVFDFRDGNDYLAFRFKHLVKNIDLCHDREDHNRYSLIFSLKHPPRLESETPINGLGYAITESERKRSDTFGGLDASRFGRCLGYRLALPEPAVEGLLLHNNLRDFGVLRRGLHSVDQSRSVATTFIGEWNPQLHAALKSIHDRQPRIGFLLRSLLDQDHFCWYHALNDTVRTCDGGGIPCNLFDLIQEMLSSNQEELVAQTLDRIHEAPGRTKYPCRLFHKLAPPGVEPEPQPQVPEYCIPIPRVVLTPCRQHVCGFELEMSNRVVRKFVREQGFAPTSFLRLHIGDENGQKLFYSELSKEVESRIRSSILSGIEINGRVYSFLAYSSSQLKEGSMWMVCPEGNWSVPPMRNAMGDFSSCRTASKYAARMGQCFSTTVQGMRGQDSDGGGSGGTPGAGLSDADSMSLSSKAGTLRHVEIPDIEKRKTVGGREEVMCHSDGTGLIRREAMTALIESLPFGSRDPCDVSIIQIRFGGAKGTLTAWDFDSLEAITGDALAPSSFGPFDVCVRPSMIKFPANYDHLEVCSIGSHVPYYLNRNVILLLRHHGVRDEIFLKMQKVMLDSLDEMLTSRKKALELVPQLSGPDSIQRKILLHMLYSGLSPATEPFLFSCLHAIRSHHLYRLRKKARVFVQDGVVLVGGIDETGLLPEGCVFLQVRKEAPRDPWQQEIEYEPIVGPVMVTKHPVMHTGDVRMLLAVDIPELRHHRNVILFNHAAFRPEADKMAGSDLDGDEYAITWDSRLFLGVWNRCKKNGETFITRNLPGQQRRQQKQRGPRTRRRPQILNMNNIVDSSEILQKANSTPLSYEKTAGETAYLPTNEGKKSEALIKHFVDYAKLDNLGPIAMLWQDYAAEYGAGCWQCLELAKLHSIAVDFPKSGIPADARKLSIPRDTPRAHWREKKDAPSFHCDSIIGQLYDEVTRRSDNDIGKRGTVITKAMAGRRVDRYGQVLSVAEGKWIEKHLDNIYNPDIPATLGFPNDRALEFATNQRALYQGQVVALMSKYNLRSEGELFTGCIRKYHKLQKNRQFEISEEVRRACRLIYQDHRTAFFREVLEVVDSFPAVRSQCRERKNISNNSQADRGKRDNSTAATSSDKYKREEDQNRSSEADDEDDEDIVMKKVEEAATAKTLPGNATLYTRLLRKTAHQLFAAYYMATYSKELRWREKEEGSKAALFSFPWIMADVVSSGMHSETSVSP